MAQYRKKPVVIEAFQWTGDQHQIEDPEWACDAIGLGSIAFQSVGTEDVKLLIRTLEGTMTANCGDWIIRGVKGEFYPCKPDIFAATYDAVETGIGMKPATPPTDAKVFREVLDHRVEGKGGGADDTRIVVLDEPGQGGACHKYAVLTMNQKSTPDGIPNDGKEHLLIDGAWFDVLMRVEFQNGPIQEVGLNGAQQEHLLAIVADRLRSFQAGPFGSRYNAVALTKTEEALRWLQRRTVDRIRHGVEGFNKA